MGINNAYESLPAREVWIEIQSRIDGAHRVVGHFPQGKCGLKFRHIESFARELPSLPAREVWIEIGHVELRTYSSWSLPAREVWIEIDCIRWRVRHVGSLPAREVWIEISSAGMKCWKPQSHFPQGKCGLKSEDALLTAFDGEVTSRKGSVD